MHHTLGNGEFELFKSMADTVVGASTIITPANAVSETERLIAEALYNRRPVYMAFPSDVVDQPLLASGAPLEIPVSNPSSLAAAVDAVANALNAAQNACALPGLLVHRLGLQDQLREFIDAAALPYATMFADKTALDEDSPNYIGMYDGRLMEESVREFVESCDAVLAIGTMQTDFNTGAFTAHLDPSRTIDIGLHRTTVGSAVYQNVEMADILRELNTRGINPRASIDIRPTSARLSAPTPTRSPPTHCIHAGRTSSAKTTSSSPKQAPAQWVWRSLSFHAERSSTIRRCGAPSDGQRLRPSGPLLPPPIGGSS